MRSTLYSLLFILGLLLIGASYFSSAITAQTTGNTFIYINNNSFDNSVSAFRLQADGRLQPLPGSPFATGGQGGRKPAIGGITVIRNAQLLFATNNADDTVTGFRINANGTLTRFAGTPITTGGRFASGVTGNKQGTRLFVANRDSDNIAAFTVENRNLIRPVNGSPFFAGNGPVDLLINPNSNLIFASLQFSHSVGTFQINANGQLQLLRQTVVAAPASHGLTLNRKTQRIYVAEGENNSISGLQVNLTTGDLLPLPNIPYFTDGTQPLAIATRKNGNLIFVSNNTNSTIAVFTPQADGTLRAVTGSPFASDSTGPAGLVINSTGTLLIVVNGGLTNSNDISVYQVLATGELHTVAGSPFPTGTFGTPTAIAILEN
jgi:6-phosphogluconolactonase (cycloisomerase 2 family)